MSCLCKLSISVPATKSGSGNPLDLLLCVGETLLKPKSELPSNQRERQAVNDVRRKQVFLSSSTASHREYDSSYSTQAKRSAKAVPALKPKLYNKNVSLLSTAQRTGDEHMEKWRRSKASEQDVNTARSYSVSRDSRRFSALSRGANTSQVSRESGEPRLQRSKQIILPRNRTKGNLKPLRPVIQQGPSISQCVGLMSEQHRGVEVRGQQEQSRAPVFSRFYKALLQEPHWRSSKDQHRHRTLQPLCEQNKCCKMKETLDTRSLGYSLRMPDRTSEHLHKQLHGLRVDRAGQEEDTAYSLEQTPHTDTASGSDDSDVEDTVEAFKWVRPNAPIFSSRWDPSQFSVTFTPKHS
ncbi:hypothetical protein AOLI_G00280760 [Acnodon oligacanthus]